MRLRYRIPCCIVWMCARGLRTRGSHYESPYECSVLRRQTKSKTEEKSQNCRQNIILIHVYVVGKSSQISAVVLRPQGVVTSRQLSPRPRASHVAAHRDFREGPKSFTAYSSTLNGSLRSTLGWNIFAVSNLVEGEGIIESRIYIRGEKRVHRMSESNPGGLGHGWEPGTPWPQL